MILPSKTYELFISQAAAVQPAYLKVIELLDQAPNFQYVNYGDLPDSMRPSNEKAPGAAVVPQLLHDQLKHSKCMLVLSDLYAHSQTWVEQQIEWALDYQIPMIAIEPQNSAGIPELVNRYAQKVVPWNTDAILSAIRLLSDGEDFHFTRKYEAIEKKHSWISRGGSWL